eukprot:324463-Chlamydomonas_euryale.AAC.2
MGDHGTHLAPGVAALRSCVPGRLPLRGVPPRMRPAATAAAATAAAGLSSPPPPLPPPRSSKPQRSGGACGAHGAAPDTSPPPACGLRTPVAEVPGRLLLLPMYPPLTACRDMRMLCGVCGLLYGYPDGEIPKGCAVGAAGSDACIVPWGCAAPRTSAPPSPLYRAPYCSWRCWCHAPVLPASRMAPPSRGS